jgi:hypothetical protein
MCCEAGYVNDYVRTKQKKNRFKTAVCRIDGQNDWPLAGNIPSAKHICINNYENRKFRRKYKFILSYKEMNCYFCTTMV